MTSIDLSLEALVPHRNAMLLLDSVDDVGDHGAHSRITIGPDSSFFQAGKGVPVWIGLEYMGQTAALIAGYQLQLGTLAPHVGLFLGSRKFQAHTGWFAPGQVLDIRCEEKAASQSAMATFSGTIHADDRLLAEAVLSVYRQPMEEQSSS